MSILLWTLAAMHHHHSCIEMFSQTPIRRPCALKCIFKPSDKFSPSHPRSFAYDRLHNFKSSWLGLRVWLEAKKEFVLMQHKHRVTIIALGSVVPCLTPVSELGMTSALFIFKVSAHTQRLINDLTQLPVTGIQRYLILWASVSSFFKWDSHFLLTILLRRLREMIYVKHLSLRLAHSITSTNSDNNNNNDIKNKL